MLTIEEAQKVLGVGRTTIYKYIKRGWLHPYRRKVLGQDYGRRIYFDSEEVEILRKNFDAFIGAMNELIIAARQQEIAQRRDEHGNVEAAPVEGPRRKKRTSNKRASK